MGIDVQSDNLSNNVNISLFVLLLTIILGVAVLIVKKLK